MTQPERETIAIRIRPVQGWRALNWRELWSYRELLWYLALRDLKVRYKQTALGAAWAVIQPLTTMVVFTIFFGKLAGMQDRIDRDVPYSLYTLCALMPWQLFAFILAQATASVVNSRGLVTKVYFPRLIAPMAPLLCGLVDLAIVLAMFFVLMLADGLTPGWPLVTLPLLIVFALATSLAVGLWCAALNALYRDVGQVLPFVTQVWLFLTPVAYPATIVPPQWRLVYGLNPMTGVVEGFRWALLGKGDPPGLLLAVSAASVAILLIGGLYYYRRMETIFADLV